MLAPSQEENINPNETRFVSHSDVSLAYTPMITASSGLVRRNDQSWPERDRQLLRGERDKLPSVQARPNHSNDPKSFPFAKITDANGHLEAANRLLRLS